MTTVADGLFQYGGMPVTGGVPFFGLNSKAFFVDPVNGSDGNDGRAVGRAFASLYRAHAMMTAGHNDVCYLIGNGASSGSCRLSITNAVAAMSTGDTTPTVGTLTWSKAACHLIGIAAPTSIGQRARIAPPTTGSRATVFNSGNFVVVSAQGCYFANLDVFCGFATGDTNQIAWTDSGGRNCYDNVNFQGKGDAASAADTGSRSLLITGSTGENTFRSCTIGLDTIKGVDAATEIEFAANSPRNRFERCIIEAYAGGIASTWVTIGASGIDRYVMFRDCLFTNPVLPASGAAASAMTVGMSIHAGAGGTVLVMNSMYYGAATMSTSALCFSNLPAANAKGGLGIVAS